MKLALKVKGKQDTLETNKNEKHKVGLNKKKYVMFKIAVILRILSFLWKQTF